MKRRDTARRMADMLESAYEKRPVTTVASIIIITIVLKLCLEML